MHDSATGAGAAPGPMAALGTNRLAIAKQATLIIPTPHYPRRPGYSLLLIVRALLQLGGGPGGCSCQGDETQKVLTLIQGIAEAA
jgi:hypothetical protein